MLKRMPLVVALVAVGLPGSGWAGQMRVAVSSNFSSAMAALAPKFEEATGHRVRISSGSTGKLYAQIRNSAPFDVFLAADSRRPRKLVEAGAVAEDGRFTYAEGRIALWSADPARVNGPETLGEGDFRRLAIANPETAPYGLAARQTMEDLGHWSALHDRVVRGENIGQAHQFVASGTAELGFVALAQISGSNRPEQGSRWVVPKEHHAPIRQQAALLTRGAEKDAARAFTAFLRGAQAAEVLRSFGYAVPE